MTDQPDPTSPAPNGGADAKWSVEGATGEAKWNEGMADTVVRLPKVPVAPRHNDGKSQGPNTGRTRAVSAKAANPPAAAAQTHGRGAHRPAAEHAPKPAPAVATTAVVPPTPPVPVAAATASAEAPKPRTTGLRRTRKARLRLSRVDPWSVMKTSFLFSIAFGIMFWVSVYVLWNVISSSGVFEAVNSSIMKIISSPNSTDTWNIQDYLSTNKVLGLSALVAAVNVVLTTALGTLTAFLYNLSANILGGLEVTLAED